MRFVISSRTPPQLGQRFAGGVLRFRQCRFGNGHHAKRERSVTQLRRLKLAGGDHVREQALQRHSGIGVGLLLIEKRPAEIGERITAGSRLIR